MDTVVLTDKEFEKQLYDGIDRDMVRVKAIKKALHKIYYLDNRTKSLEYQKRYNDMNKERIGSARRKYYLLNKEKLRLKLVRLLKKRINDQKYRESHREILRLRDKKYKEENRIEINRRARERNQKIKEQTNVIQSS